MKNSFSGEGFKSSPLEVKIEGSCPRASLQTHTWGPSFNGNTEHLSFITGIGLELGITQLSSCYSH